MARNPWSAFAEIIAQAIVSSSKRRFYTGIGSRRAPPSVEFAFKEVVLALNNLDYTVRSGGANGPDSWVEKYATRTQVFLPCQGFNGNPSLWCEPVHAAFEIAARVHPAWDRLDDFAKKLHARNVHQVLGPSIYDTPHFAARPSDFIVCWTPGGKTVGGTATAIRVAELHSIPVFNLANDEAQRDLFRAERVFDQILSYASQLREAEDARRRTHSSK